MNSKSGITINVVGSSRTHLEAYLRANLRKAAGLVASQLRELSVALIDDDQMSELHKQFLGIAGPTDVLTFPLEQDHAGRDVAGEVVICVPEAQRQCATHGNPLKKEVLLYALHGMLHLSGFDDRTPQEFRKMHRTEDQILQKLGIGKAFDVDGKAARAASASPRNPSSPKKPKPARRVTGEF